MGKEYKIQYLDDKKFEALSLVNPRYANTKDDLGFADMQTNRIFVRKTGNRLTDLFITQHELEHLLEINKNHEDEYKIRHKKGGAARSIVPAILGGLAYLVNPILGAAVGGLSGAGMNATAAANHPELGNVGQNALMGGLTGALGGYGAGSMAKGAIAGATNAGLEPATSGILGRIAGGAKGALGFGASPSTTNAVIPETLGGAPGVGTVISKVPGAAANATLPSGANALKMLNAGIPLGNLLNSGTTSPINMNWSQPGATAQNLGFQAPVTGASPSGVSAPASNINWSATTPKTETQAALPQGIQNAGTGVSGVTGEVTKELVKQPVKKSLWDKLGGFIGLGADEAKRTILGASIPLFGNQMFTQTPEPFTPQQSQLFNETAQMVRSGAQVQLTPPQSQAITAQYDTALQQARQNIMDRYKMLRPGSDIENDSNFKEALIDLESDFAEKKANALASAQLGLSAQQTQMMGELAQMEIYTLAQKAGISFQEAKNFKDMLSQLGFMVAKGGQPTGGRVIIQTNP